MCFVARNCTGCGSSTISFNLMKDLFTNYFKIFICCLNTFHST
jgi:hypothetical protein